MASALQVCVFHRISTWGGSPSWSKVIFIGGSLMWFSKLQEWSLIVGGSLVVRAGFSLDRSCNWMFKEMYYANHVTMTYIDMILPFLPTIIYFVSTEKVCFVWRMFFLKLVCDTQFTSVDIQPQEWGNARNITSLASIAVAWLELWCANKRLAGVVQVTHSGLQPQNDCKFMSGPRFTVI